MLISAEVLSFMLLRKQGAKVSEVKGFLNTEVKNQEKDEIIKQGNRKQMLQHSREKGGMPLAAGMAKLHPLCPLHNSVYHAGRLAEVFKQGSPSPDEQSAPRLSNEKSQDYR